MLTVYIIILDCSSQDALKSETSKPFIIAEVSCTRWYSVHLGEVAPIVSEEENNT